MGKRLVTISVSEEDLDRIIDCIDFTMTHDLSINQEEQDYLHDFAESLNNLSFDKFEWSPGDQFYWNDPDEGRLSRMVTIARVERRGDIVCVWESNGTYLEVLEEEMS